MTARRIAALLLLTFSAGAGAQTQAGRREMVGFVRDSAGAGIEGATVQIAGSVLRTDPRGSFRLWAPDVDTLTIVVHRLGFEALEAMLTATSKQWDTVVVELNRVAQSLAGMTVTSSAAARRSLALKDFDERKARGLGIFVTRADILARNPSRLSDLLRDKRGVRLVRLMNNYYGVRFAAYSAARRPCTPSMWVDGQLAPGMEIDDLLPHDIYAIELYESFASVPAEFAPRSSTVPCGTIVIWTRVPGLADKRPTI
ncbi:MAG TPA: carboxypeptidase regulatory-like domain-containing protein [Gemmatimonadaceae bacterium]|nr:carboxypeptidase regulatory-like domain-containing protein [Gemmatimonadaceae bacterium]